MSSYRSLQCIIYAKVFQSDRILSSTNGFIFQIISSLIESMGQCLTWPDCKDLIFCCLFVLFCFVFPWGCFSKHVMSYPSVNSFVLSRVAIFPEPNIELSRTLPRGRPQCTVELCLTLLFCFSFWQSVQRVEMRLVV